MKNLLLISSSYAGDGGYLEHCQDALKNFYSVPAAKHVLFVPYANAYNWRQCANESIAQFKKLGINAKSILDYPDPRAALDDPSLAGIFIAGGNTFKLLASLYDYDFVAPIQRAAKNGLPYAATSAGAVVACPGIYTTNDMPMVEPKTFAALNLVPFQINPHFVPGELIANHHGETREQRIRQFHTERATPVVGLRESSWLEIHSDSNVLGGEDGATLFEAGQEPQVLARGPITMPSS
jgi:dipeptidase E